jgi:predicted RNA-binding Zn-ribbon protein involved in translation (DUF1610 family)
MAFRELEANEGELRFSCPDCGHAIKKRKDSFLPGAHMLICAECGRKGSEIEQLDGELVGVRKKDSAGRVG